MDKNYLTKTKNAVNIAVVILSCKDYESLEIALANYLEITPPPIVIECLNELESNREHNANSKSFDNANNSPLLNIHFFILQNGFNTYDTTRTLQVALRYQALYPHRIQVITDIPEQQPYDAIKQLLEDKRLEEYHYICKVDDDTFPITRDWLKNLYLCYLANKAKYQDKMGYVLPLVNNNPYGFKRTLEILDLQNEYHDKIGRIHLAGFKYTAVFPMHNLYPERLCKKDEIFENAHGTIWRLPYIARWIHHKTTLNVDEWIAKTQHQHTEILDKHIRYSINCMFFEKQFWFDIEPYMGIDEERVHEMCFKKDLKNIVCLNVPFVHLFFHVQRDENKDLIVPIRDYYQKRLNLIYPIALNANKDYELENRIRSLSIEIEKIHCNVAKLLEKKPWFGWQKSGGYKRFYLFKVRVYKKKNNKT